jgi:hypothetical protein
MQQWQRPHLVHLDLQVVCTVSGLPTVQCTAQLNVATKEIQTHNPVKIPVVQSEHAGTAADTLTTRTHWQLSLYPLHVDGSLTVSFQVAR